MSTERCLREDELLDSLGRGYVGDELDAHVDSCAACSELRVVAGALLDDRTAAMTEASVPSAGTMWFRMQLRQRQEAQSIARRSLLIGQAATLVIALTVVIALFGSDVAVGLRDAYIALRFSTTPLVLILATSLFLVPLAGWVAVKQK